MNNQYIEAKKRIKGWLDAAIDEDLLCNPPKNYKQRRTVISAVSAFVILSLAGFFIVRGTDDNGQPGSWIEECTAAAETKMVSLPDGSTIWLHNNSMIMYPEKFTGDTRQVFTSGEIFAEIKSDPAHPFIVSSNGVNVRVKGTTFNFKSYSDSKDAELTLLKGAVDMNLSVCGKPQTVTVKPGTTVKANLENGRITRFNTDAESYVSWKDASVIYFNDESLQGIANELQREFGVRIVITSDALAKTRYYVSFLDVKSPADIFEALDYADMMDVTRQGDTYYISSTNSVR